jgi:hypothetical protein
MRRMLRENGDWVFFKIQCDYEKKGKWIYCTPDHFYMRDVYNIKDEKFKKAWKEWEASGDCWQKTGEHGFFNLDSAIYITEITQKKNPKYDFRVVKVYIYQEVKVMRIFESLEKEENIEMPEKLPAICEKCANNDLCKYIPKAVNLKFVITDVTQKSLQDSPLSAEIKCEKCSYDGNSK